MEKTVLQTHSVVSIGTRRKGTPYPHECKFFSLDSKDVSHEPIHIVPARCGLQYNVWHRFTPCPSVTEVSLFSKGRVFFLQGSSSTLLAWVTSHLAIVTLVVTQHLGWSVLRSYDPNAKHTSRVLQSLRLLVSRKKRVANYQVVYSETVGIVFYHSGYAFSRKATDTHCRDEDHTPTAKFWRQKSRNSRQYGRLKTTEIEWGTGGDENGGYDRLGTHGGERE